MLQSKFYSVVIPLYNEEENVPLLIRSVGEALDGFEYELILVDDFSQDGTRKAVVEVNHERVKLIELKRNYGQSSALMAGIDLAKGDYIITLDGDMQNDPADIPMMVDLLDKEDNDLVVGIRQKRKDSLIRTFPSKIANAIIKSTTKLNVKDHGCALKVFTKETAKELVLYGESHRFVTLIAHINGARISEVPVRHHPRKFGVSKYGLGRTFKVINDLILLLFQQRYIQKPIYLFGSAGIFTLATGVLISLYLLFEKLSGNDIGGRPLLILSMIMIFAGIQLFTVGIIIDLQMKTYFESQDKRPFRIRKVVSFE